MTRLEELEKILETVCGVYENDCSKCPKKAECEEYSHIYEDRNKTEDINFKSEEEKKMKRFRDKNGCLSMGINEIAKLTGEEGRRYYKEGIFLFAKDGREYVRLHEKDDETLTHFHSFDGFHLFIPTECLGTYLPDVASDGMELIRQDY